MEVVEKLGQVSVVVGLDRNAKFAGQRRQAKQNGQRGRLHA